MKYIINFKSPWIYFFSKLLEIFGLINEFYIDSFARVVCFVFL